MTVAILVFYEVMARIKYVALELRQRVRQNRRVTQDNCRRIEVNLVHCMLPSLVSVIL